MQKIREKLLAVLESLVGILEQAVALLKMSLTTPQGFVVAALLILTGIDLLLLGHLGFIRFVVGQFKEVSLVLVEVAKAGGWQLVVILLILALVKK